MSQAGNATPDKEGERSVSIKAVIGTIEEAPDALREHYVAGEDGTFALAIEGVEGHPQTRALKNALEAERDGRRKATRRAAALAKRLGNVGGGNGGGKETFDESAFDRLLNQRLARATRLFAAERGALERSRDQAKESLATVARELERERFDRVVVTAASNAGARAMAMPDILARARSEWSAAGDAAGGGERSAAALARWLQALTMKAPHLFEPNRGGAAPRGAVPASGRGTRTVDGVLPNAVGRNLEAIATGKTVVA